MTVPRTHRTRAWALVLALTTTGSLALAVPTTSSAAAAAPTDRSHDIAAAAARYGVPASVLSAYAYAQTRWDDHDGAPSTDGGYGPAHLVDGSLLEVSGRDGGDGSGRAARDRIDTLGRAARLTGLSRRQLERDPAANLQGAAALLADEQRRAHRPVGTTTDPAQWYAAIAATAPTREAGVALADATVAALRTGAQRTTSDGEHVTLAPTRTASVAAQRTPLAAQPARRTWPTAKVDCPAQLACEWVPAPYVQTGTGPGDYGNHDLARRPMAPSIDTIVIHDTEGYYDHDMDLVKDPEYLAWNYTIRSSDGHVAQHLSPRDIGWQAGNWYVNMHSIGVEHEGFAVKGATWFSEAMYRSSATLVKHLATEYHIPLDRGHVIGHDQVPGTSVATTPGMHWDPGPYWDWEHYFELMGAPLDRDTRTPRATSNRPRVGDAVRVLPGFAHNVQPITGCDAPGVACAPQGSNVLPVRTAPDAGAPLVNDIGLKAGGEPATWEAQDWGGKAAAGTDYVVADVRGDWTAIWFAGRKGWVHDPAAAPTLRVLKTARTATPKGTTAPTYGRAYPEASAYPAGVTPQEITPLAYSLAAGQSYVVLDENPPTDYYLSKTFSLSTPGDHVDIAGRDRYVLVNLGHRVTYVRRADVDLRVAR